MTHRTASLVAVALLLAGAHPAQGQSRGYAGGAFGVAVDPQTPTEVQVGGTTWTAAVMVGAAVSPRLGIEVEAAFDGDLDAETYTYRPSPGPVEVETQGRRTLVTGLLRIRAGVVEPVIGLGVVHSTVRRHAAFTQGGGPYFDDARADNGLAFVSGLDIAAAVTPQVAIVPTLRVYVVDRGAPPAFGNTASGGPVLVHAGAGVRIRF